MWRRAEDSAAVRALIDVLTVMRAILVFTVTTCGCRPTIPIGTGASTTKTGPATNAS